jgi:hypothetical protein
MPKGKLLAILKVRTPELMHPEDMNERRRAIFEALGYSCQKEQSDHAISIFPGLTVKVEAAPRRDPDFDTECGLDHDRAFNPDETLILENLHTTDPDEGTVFFELRAGDWDEIEIIS